MRLAIGEMSQGMKEDTRAIWTALSSLNETINGDAENARHEIAGHENAAPDCKGGKCKT